MDAAETGRRIKRAREARGWDQQDLADALTRQRGGKRVGVRSVGRWERGETTPRNAGGALEKVLKISLNGGEEPDPREEELRDLAAGLDIPAEEVQQLIDRYRRQRKRPPETRAG